MNKGAKITLTVIGSIVAAVVAIILILVIGLTIASHAKFGEYYSIRIKEAKNPGLWDNYIPQGMTFNDDENYYATCGYMKDGSASRIYTVDRATKKQHMYTLTSGGEPYTGHTGGLQYQNGKFYLASEKEGVFTFDANLVGDAKSVEIGKPEAVENNSSYCFTDENFIYVGEYAHTNAYECDHPVTFEDHTNTAIMAKYALDDLSKPVAVYSIPDEVQGVAVSADGTIYFSTSWALNPSKYLTYKADKILDTKTEYQGAPLYFLAEPTKCLKGPFFSEDVDLLDGKLITMNEGAANKYYIGKFIFDYSIFSFKLEDLE